jgi:archaemetzincin
MKQSLLMFCCLALCYCGCRGKTAPVRQQNFPDTIIIQPFTGISTEKVNAVVAEMNRVYPFIRLNTSIDLPALAWHPARKRYRADSLINWLAANAATHTVVIGLTDKDVSTTKGNIADWGVMGLGFCPGRACIASAYRLQKGRQTAQLCKVALHGWGHTRGLAHCTNGHCFMNDAEGKNNTETLTRFCGKCKTLLNKQG